MAGSKIATAYVQVLPSMEGVAPAVKKQFTGAGGSAGGIFGGKFAAALKGVLASAAIGAALKKTLTEGADLQQLEGGVQKIFNDMDTSRIFTDAANAYKDLNMSANEYLATINDVGAAFSATMGDEKGYQMAKTGLQAISDYASGTGKSVDVLSEKFTMITRSTASYQSIADQFSGILPATSADFLKQAQAAGILSGSYKKLTDVPVAEYQEAVTQMLAKGVDALNLTGNTAAETATTLSGSFAAMKGAFSNFLGNLALGKDISPSLNALAETVSTFLLGNLVPMVWNIVTALPGALVTFLQALIPADVGTIVDNLVSNFSSFMSSQLPVILAQGLGFIESLINGFSAGAPGFMTTVGTVLQSLYATLYEALPLLLNAGTELISYLAQGFSLAVSSVIGAVTGIMGNVLSSFVQHLPDMLAQGIALILNLIAGVISMQGDIVAACINIVKSIIDSFKQTDWAAVGDNIIEGIRNGITRGVGKIIAAAKEAAQKAFEAAKSALGIKSPSRLFRNEIGYRMSEGTALGISDGISLVDRAVNSMANAASGTFRSRLRMNADFSDSGSGGLGRKVIINQYIYSEAKTAADLMREARYQAEKAVLLGV